MIEATLRGPTPADGPAMWALVRDSGALDLNSPYAYLLLGSHFAATSLLAVRPSDGGLLGFVGAYHPPPRPAVLFIWQIGVSATARRQGLASRLLDAAVARSGARYLEATVTPDNRPSRALFRGFARRHGAACDVSLGFSADCFPDGHAPEELFRIGPLPAAAATAGEGGG